MSDPDAASDGAALSGWKAWAALAALAVLILASRALDRHVFGAWTSAALAAGVAVWLALAAAVERRERLPALDPDPPRPRAAALAASVAAAGAAFWKMPPNEFHLWPTVVWIAAVALWAAAWLRNGGDCGAGQGRRRSAPEWIVLAAIMAVGAFFCYWRLHSIPPNPVSDHAEEMLDMLDMGQGRYPTFFLRNLGIGPLHFYWTLLVRTVLRLPLRYLSVKIATSTVELLAVAAMYAAGRELGGTPLGLSAAVLAAWGKWPFSLGRQGLEYTYAVLPTVVVVWALLRFQRRGDRASALLAGAAIGIGLCSYPAFRVVPLLVPLALATALMDRRRRGKRWQVVGAGVLIAATSAIVALPVLNFTLRSPQGPYFWSRSLTRLTSAERLIAGDPLVVFGGNLWNMARAFHWRGSSTWTVMLENDPFLDVVTGGLLLAGSALLLIRILRGSWRWAWLLPAVFLLTLPSTLSLAYPNENPSLNRAGPAVPVIFLLAGGALALLARGFWRSSATSRVVGLAAVALLLAWSAQSNYERYFVDFSESYDHLIEHSMEMAEALREEHAGGTPYANMYLLGMDYWVDGRNIAFQIDDPAWADDHLLRQGSIPEGLTPRPLVFLYHPSDLRRLDILDSLYHGERRLVPQSFSDRNFGVYIVR